MYMVCMVWYRSTIIWYTLASHAFAEMSKRCERYYAHFTFDSRNETSRQPFLVPRTIGRTLDQRDDGALPPLIFLLLFFGRVQVMSLRPQSLRSLLLRNLLLLILLGVLFCMSFVRAMSTSTSNKKSAALIFLHGLGDTPAGWSSLQFNLPQLKKRLGNVVYVFPPAPIIPISINGGTEMPGVSLMCVFSVYYYTRALAVNFEMVSNTVFAVHAHTKVV